MDCKSGYEAQFKLYGIVHHLGSKNRGHYISEVKDMTKRHKDDQVWYECDDEKIREIDGPQLSSSTAYLLFFWKTS